jgi:hypothetical protein
MTEHASVPRTVAVKTIAGGGESPSREAGRVTARAQLYFGQVMHRRMRPVKNRFVYPVFFLRVPLSDPHCLRGPLFGVNCWNLFSFYFRDHGARDGSSPLGWIRALLVSEGLGDVAGEVWLQTFPRVLGYVFNPVSFWFCHDRSGALRAVLCEVSNTFGERHHYLLAHPDGGPINVRPEGAALRARKVFHVSPFCAVGGEYRFCFRQEGEGAGATVLARIDYADEAGDLLHTSISGRAAPFTTIALARAFVTYPWMTLLMIARIHWQAARLWIKRVPFFSKPVPPVEDVSR